MKKKIFVIIGLIALTLTITGCGKEKSAKEFKEQYEKVNGKKLIKNLTNRKVNIKIDNPYKEVDAASIISKIKNKETFYVYFGFETCPWCRSVIEKSIEVAQTEKIDTIYYVNVYDIRDTKEYINNKIVTTKKGSDDYYELLKLLNDVLDDYKIEDEAGKSIDTNERRIFAPNFIYVKNGKALKKIEGISSKQTDAFMELTEEILNDEEEIFTNFFTHKKVCTGDTMC